MQARSLIIVSRIRRQVETQDPHSLQFFYNNKEAFLEYMTSQAHEAKAVCPESVSAATYYRMPSDVCRDGKQDYHDRRSRWTGTNHHLQKILVINDAVIISNLY